LIVDDLTINRHILKKMLESFGMTSEIANSCDEAIALLKNSQGSARFDIAVLDHHMPVKSGVDLAEIMRNSPATAGLPIVFLTSGDLDALKKRAHHLQIETLLNKPVRATALKAVISDLTARHEEKTTHQNKRHTVSRPDETPKFDLRVAVTEDNATNRLLMKKMLGPLVKELVLWENGQVAVDEIAAWAPDIVFMDLSMPVMDGLTATRKIRISEKVTGKKPVPIIALTANAMAEDKDRCLEAGMSGYLAKPVRKADLLEVITDPAFFPAQPEPNVITYRAK